MITTDVQFMSNDLVTANIYFKDGSKKMVTLLSELIESSQKMIEYISTSNLNEFIQTSNPAYIESLNVNSIEGIDFTFK